MLTERQEAVLDFVREYQRAQNVTPSTREVARQFGCSQPTALKHLQALARKTQLDKLADGKWGLKASQVQAHLFEAPIYGAIPAGLPAMQEQTPEGTVGIDPAVFGVRNPRPHHFWLLRVTGDSMTGAKIFDGDLVALVRRDPRPGEIIAALVDETSTTLKRMVRERGRILLRAANPRYPDIVPQHLESQGVVVGAIRREFA
ncbi:MAG TPA: transcriptional repressor LexA [Opitutaceae bacterium]|nr:transcriptional repressor LexA [Opitutaceae bacterium]